MPQRAPNSMGLAIGPPPLTGLDIHTLKTMGVSWYQDQALHEGPACWGQLQLAPITGTL